VTISQRGSIGRAADARADRISRMLGSPEWGCQGTRCPYCVSPPWPPTPEPGLSVGASTERRCSAAHTVLHVVK
jgi:hypothetical protein